MAYNLNLNTDFVLLQAIKNRLISTNPSIKLFCDNSTTAYTFLELFHDWRDNLSIWHWRDTDENYSKFHIKAVAVDKNMMYIGSANFSKTAMEHSAECGIFINSPDCYESLMAYTSSLEESGPPKENQLSVIFCIVNMNLTVLKKALCCVMTVAS